MLSHLAPVTPVHPIDGLPDLTGTALCTAELAERVDPATAQLPCEAEDDEITTVVWHRVRPLHPARLFEAVDELVTSSVRSRGRFWLATRHPGLWVGACSGNGGKAGEPWYAG
ncbi:GTP-binding protein [Microtetraspora niveoalba]|uniref:GTP-binding protein n=1 Tax=Microtetraspora niveoalba TaxID=46175 RepID=UPI00082A3F52|nr:GTP-binding protein [Microtetraspora niveoalba]